MSYASAHLTTKNIKWLGVRPSDYKRYKIPQECLIPMTKHDIKLGNDLLKEDFIQQNEKWTKEISLMLKLKKKAEIQALSSYGFQYLTKTFLPQKLRDGDWTECVHRHSCSAILCAVYSLWRTSISKSPSPFQKCTHRSNC